jgi:hypothetical protein
MRGSSGINWRCRDKKVPLADIGAEFLFQVISERLDYIFGTREKLPYFARQK